MKVLRLLSLSFLTLAAGCRDEGEATFDANPSQIDANPLQIDGGGGGGNTIYELQNGTVAVGAPVELRGVIVTAYDTFGSRVGNIWVQEPAGGPYSGVLIFNGTIATGTIAVGDIVDVTGGILDEFALTTDTSGNTTTEITPPDGGSVTITKVGTGTVPAPMVLDPGVIAGGDLEPPDPTALAEAEKWEGVLVTIEDVAVSQAVRQIGGTTTDYTFKEFKVTGPVSIQTSLTGITDVGPDGTLGTVDDTVLPGYDLGDCFVSITGVVDYFFDYHIYPRATEDLVQGGTGCGATSEDPATTCGDSLDNDGDGFEDCDDRDCWSLPTCFPAMTITDVQMGSAPSTVLPEGSRVEITGVVTERLVSSGSGMITSFFLQETGTGGPWKGVFVFPNAPLATTVLDVGSAVTVQGVTDEYFGNTEVAQATVTVTGTGTVPAAIPVTVADLAGATTSEQWEGVFIDLQNVRVVQVLDALNYGDMTVGTTTENIRVGTRAIGTFPGSPAPTDCYSSIVGAVDYSRSDSNTPPAANVYKVLPRTGADMVTGTTCP